VAPHTSVLKLPVLSISPNDTVPIAHGTIEVTAMLISIMHVFTAEAPVGMGGDPSHVVSAGTAAVDPISPEGQGGPGIIVGCGTQGVTQEKLLPSKFSPWPKAALHVGIFEHSTL
jgi:hypothetical protein